MVQDWDQQYLDFSPLLPSQFFSPTPALKVQVNGWWKSWIRWSLACRIQKLLGNLDLSTNQGIPCIPHNPQSFLIISTPCPVLGTIARVWAGVAPHWSVAPASVELPTCNARPDRHLASGNREGEAWLRFFGARRLAKRGKSQNVAKQKKSQLQNKIKCPPRTVRVFSQLFYLLNWPETRSIPRLYPNLQGSGTSRP